MKGDRRGATEVLGFILAFAIITASIGIIYTSGFGGLQDVRDDEQLQNVERAFEVFAANMEGVRRFGTPSRSTEIRLRDGRLVLAPQTLLQINVTDDASGVSTVYNATMRPVMYVSNDEDTRIIYEGGAVFRSSEEASFMLSEPGWILSDEQLVIPAVITYRQDGPNSLSTAGTALLIAQSTNRLANSNTSSSLTVDVTVNTTSARAAAWERYFSRLSGGGTTPPDSDASDGEITYRFKVETVRVIRAIIGLTLSP